MLNIGRGCVRDGGGEAERRGLVGSTSRKLRRWVPNSVSYRPTDWRREGAEFTINLNSETKTYRESFLLVSLPETLPSTSPLISFYCYGMERGGKGSS